MYMYSTNLACFNTRSVNSSICLFFLSPSLSFFLYFCLPFFCSLSFYRFHCLSVSLLTILLFGISCMIFNTLCNYVSLSMSFYVIFWLASSGCSSSGCCFFFRMLFFLLTRTITAVSLSLYSPIYHNSDFKLIHISLFALPLYYSAFSDMFRVRDFSVASRHLWWFPFLITRLNHCFYFTRGFVSRFIVQLSLENSFIHSFQDTYMYVM